MSHNEESREELQVRTPEQTASSAEPVPERHADNVIFLEAHRSKRKVSSPKAAQALPPLSHEGAEQDLLQQDQDRLQEKHTQAEHTDAADGRGKLFHLGQTPPDPIAGRLYWLYCPVCDSLEYSALAVRGGRRHNPCGTMVQEAEVPLDLREEVTLAELNLERLEALVHLLAGHIERFRTYRRRLEQAAGSPVTTYPPESAAVERMTKRGIDGMGLFSSTFLQQPEMRFRNRTKPEAPSPKPAVEAAPESKLVPPQDDVEDHRS